MSHALPSYHMGWRGGARHWAPDGTLLLLAQPTLNSTLTIGLHGDGAQGGSRLPAAAGGPNPNPLAL
eukprot:scaffold96518_cov36-Phaeocystis_antarctica.AAC.1